MDKIKLLKNFILILLVIIINTSPLDVFANPPSEDDGVYKNKSTILDGEIGEWDPGISDKPNFNDTEVEVDGKLPEEGKYYTISVTVPLNMEFIALNHNTFYSPVYTIKNNGSKNISVKLSTFSRKKNTTLNDENTVPLYVEKVNRDDNRTQIELKMCTIEDLNNSVKVNKEIDLTNLTEETELYRLSANQKKGVTFDSKRWDIPKITSENGKATSDFICNFIVSIVTE
ncbi:MAG: hypothetical protein E7K67_07925 [Peptostreptococcaceae bacterium]|nr:hypothetical protein [Peptostreptococcaceae bacterium]